MPKFLFDIIDACKKITEFTAGLAFEQFTSNALVKSAVHMQFIIIGEALIRLRASGSTLYNSLPRRFLSYAMKPKDYSTPDAKFPLSYSSSHAPMYDSPMWPS